MRVAREYRTASKENYNRYLREHPSVKLTYKQYCSILSVCNKKFVTKALETGEPVRLPFGFGKLVICKYRASLYRLDENGVKRIRLPIDWVKSKQEGFKVYNMNYHSDGFSFKWKWLYGYARVFMAELLVMKPTRWTSRELAKYILKDKHYSQLYKNY